MKNSELLRAWFELEKRYKGLQDMKLYATEKAQGSDLEEFCGEVLDMIYAPNLDLPDLDEQMKLDLVPKPETGWPPATVTFDELISNPADRIEHSVKPKRKFTLASFRETLNQLGMIHD